MSSSLTPLQTLYQQNDTHPGLHNLYDSFTRGVRLPDPQSAIRNPQSAISMPTACINLEYARVSLKSERLEVFGRNEQTQRDEVLREIPIRDLDRLIVSESVQITSQALATLMREKIPVNILGWSGQFLGGFLPAHNAHGLARLRQYRQTLDPAFGLLIARQIVTAKLYNQRRVLQRLHASRNSDRDPSSNTAGAPSAELPNLQDQTAAPTPSVPHSAIASPLSTSSSPSASLPATLAWLDALFPCIKRAQTVDELRGYEGASTARYFGAWASFLPTAFPFERRSTRPPLNPVNACISFGATLLYTESVAFLHAHGLDPALGLLHSTDDGRWSLALDLIEPFRPVLVEALALDFFSHQILNSSHFQQREGGVYLNEEGRKKFFLQYERRMERQFLSEAVGHRTTLRQQLEAQAVHFKVALEEPEKFEPFLMN
jgi:CRISPR-associated protein Cas1